MSDAGEEAKTPQDMVDQFVKAMSGSQAPDLARAMFGPMQQQFEVLRLGFEKQAEFQRDLMERVFRPMRQMLEGLQESAENTRAAGDALRRAGDLLTQQADAIEQALQFAQPFLDMTKPASSGGKGNEGETR